MKSIEFKVKIKPWVWVYLSGLQLFCFILNTTPDYDNVWLIVRKGLTLEMEGWE